MKSPVLLIAFNRPDNTKEVFEAIRSAKPPKLFIACDAPRENVPTDVEKCNQVRQIFQDIDWQCEVHTLYQEKNLGCSKAPSDAISWFFNHVEKGIILEDDCKPCMSFYVFCDELLDKYENDKRIKLISGNNFLKGKKAGESSYYFSKVPITWGWATWKRAWAGFDIEMSTYPEFKAKKKFKDVFSHKLMRWYWIKMLDRVFSGEIKTAWDYQWFYSMWSNNELCITPNVNLVQNIGFDGSGTHTSFDAKKYSIPTTGIEQPLIHPKFVLADNKTDELAFENFYNVKLSKKQVFLKTLFSKKFRDTV